MNEEAVQYRSGGYHIRETRSRIVLREVDHGFPEVERVGGVRPQRSLQRDHHILASDHSDLRGNIQRRRDEQTLARALQLDPLVEPQHDAIRVEQHGAVGGISAEEFGRRCILWTADRLAHLRATR